MPAELVSVIIPTRNRPERVCETIRSVLSQTHAEVEIIVVDDGSDPAVAPLLRSRFGERITCLRHGACLGANAARNTGLARARGSFVAFLDDDDQWLPEKLSRQVEAFRQGPERLALVGCGYVYQAEGRVVKEVVPVLPADALARLLAGNFLGSTSLPLLRSSAVRKVGGFDATLPSCQDWDLWLRLCARFAVTIVAEPLVKRTLHDGQISADLVRKIEGRRLLLDKHRELLARHPAALTSQWRRLGTLELLAGDSARSRDAFRKALASDPLDPRSWLGRVLNWLPSPVGKWLLGSCALTRMAGRTLYH